MADFCTKCGKQVPVAALTFDTLPGWWKKAAVGLVGLTVLGVLISAVWPSGEAVVPEEEAVAVESVASEPARASSASP
ncbi:MAG: hypothetical protein O2968_18985, partial [Acidobacteria bacterium]|nr:hypothetical protein [Acidobacteriota bacterium]